MHRYHNQKLPNSFTNFFTPSPAAERLPTRRANYKVERSRNNTIENLPSVKLPLTWNAAPIELKLEESLQTFKKKIINNILSNYVDHVDCDDRNCPDCSGQ